MDWSYETKQSLVESHGLKIDEFDSIVKGLGREPNLTELGIFSAMWNEHCSYKSSKYWLKKLPTSGDRVVQGPGENAGVIDIDDGDVAVFQNGKSQPSIIYRTISRCCNWSWWNLKGCFYNGSTSCCKFKCLKIW